MQPKTGEIKVLINAAINLLLVSIVYQIEYSTLVKVSQDEYRI